MSDKATNLDLPTLDRLHAEASRTPWIATGIELSSVTDSATPSREQLEKNAAFIAALVNTFPSLSARLKEQHKAVLGLMDRVHDLENERSARISLLEETLRGILQEKRSRRERACNQNDGDTVEELDQQIAWLESVLGGGK